MTSQTYSMSMADFVELFPDDDPVQRVAAEYRIIDGAVWVDEHAKRALLEGMRLAVALLAVGRGLVDDR